MEFLSSGGSDYAINLLKKLGVDMTKPEPVNLALDSFARLVDQLKDLI
ncbi:MAG: hypothetical protein U5N58_14890 [Actinomycetota bacterium]|nr:hypothetical protein [Actinomycetota bacterium]